MWIKYFKFTDLCLILAYKSINFNHCMIFVSGDLVADLVLTIIWSWMMWKSV